MPTPHAFWISLPIDGPFDLPAGSTLISADVDHLRGEVTFVAVNADIQPDPDHLWQLRRPSKTTAKGETSDLNIEFEENDGWRLVPPPGIDAEDKVVPSDGLRLVVRVR